MKLSEELQEIADMELEECIELAKKLEVENKELATALFLSYYYEAAKQGADHDKAQDIARDKVSSIKAKAVEGEG